MLNKIWKNRWILRFIFKTIYINFHYLPFNQACRLPILLYKTKLIECRGSVTIEGPVKFGMIKLGTFKVSIFPNTGFKFENRGNIVFSGCATIGNDSAISVNRTGTLSFGRNFSATCGLKIACYHKIYFGNDNLIGWNCQFTDTDFHRLSTLDGKRPKGYGSITTGNNIWFGNNCHIYKNVSIPDKTVIAAETVLLKTVSTGGYEIIANDKSARIINKGAFHDNSDDIIEYES